MSNDTELKPDPSWDADYTRIWLRWQRAEAQKIEYRKQLNTRPTPSGPSVMVDREDLQELMVGSAQYKDATEATRDRVKALLAQEKTND